MLLADALQALSLELDVLYNTTQGRLLTHLARQLTRLSHCEESLQLAVLQNGQVHADHKRGHDLIHQELDDAQAKNKKLTTRMQRERLERNEEKEWIAALWPDGAVLPTILKPYTPEANDIRFVSHVEVEGERRRLQAQVNRRAAKERVLVQIEIAAQWKMVIVPPSKMSDGEYIAGRTFYQNMVTGESVREAPVAMFYEPPAQWDQKKMDWKESYPLESFYEPSGGDTEPEETNAPASPTDGATTQEDETPKHETEMSRSPVLLPDTREGEDDQDEDEHEDDGDSEDGSSSNGDDPHQSQTGNPSKARSGSKQDDEDESEDEEDQLVDPAEIRVELELAFDRSKQLQDQLNKALAEQRALALRLLNASRESFDREKETLEQEDEENKKRERQKRKAQQQEEAAAKAAAQAQERKAMDKSLQPKFVRDSVAKKDMTLAKDEELFEKELQAFAVEQRRDRKYLAAPLAKDERVRFRHQLDDEFVHMKTIEQHMLAIEQTEFDLLEKTALRLEDALKRCEELTDVLEKARSDTRETDEELTRLPLLIAKLEEATLPPSEPRPTQEELLRAKERFIEAEEKSGGEQEKQTENPDPADTDGDQDGEEKVADEQDEEQEEQEHEEEQDEQEDGPANEEPIDPQAVARDEAELQSLKRAVEAQKRWQAWELEEVVRLEDLAAAYDRFKALEKMQRRLLVDVALFESDFQFFEQLATREKQTNETLWTIQANSQVERARFLMERAAREESVFQVKDEYDSAVQRLENARVLPRQARNPLEKIQLIEQSKQDAERLSLEVSRLQTRYETEMEAKSLLVELETRFCAYSLSKLQEEASLFAEKQALWDLNVDLHVELRTKRDVIETLYAVLQGEMDATTSEAASRAAYEDATALFDEKLQRVEAVRSFLLLCYDREARWRSLATVALIKDTTSDKWMTQMQRERQEQMLTALQHQHEMQQLPLRQEIKLLTKVKELLQSQIVERDAKLEKLRREYQQSSDAVRLEMEQIVFGLKDQLLVEQRERLQDQQRAKDERARILLDHEQLTTQLQQRIVDQELTNEQQWHWLTAAKRELHAQRVANEELLMGYQSLEKRRAMETNDMRFRISSQITKINGIEMWNLALKIQAREAHSEKIKLRHEIEQLVRHHKQQQRLLRLENWKHRVTAQAILTDVDALFLFFAQGVEILGGATPHTNTKLRENGGIELLALLAHRSSQSAIRLIASKALGLLAWNANATPRALGWKAKKLWFDWESQQSTRILQQLVSQNLDFDSVASESSDEMNWLADTSSHGGGQGESDSDVFDKQKQILFLKMWNARDDVEHPDVNSANQEYIGLAPSVLQSIIDLCRSRPASSSSSSSSSLSPEIQLKIQRNALRSLAINVMNTRNTAIVGRMDGCIPLLVGLLRRAAPSPTLQATTTASTISLDDSGVMRHAIEALANLAFQNAFNQSQICRAGAIPLLVANCSRHSDVDVLLASVRALAHLSFESVECCGALFDAHGMAVLTKLCHSYRIHDAIDLEVYETIQSGAAETISNVITVLDAAADGQLPPHSHGDPQQDLEGSATRDRNVALAILAASEDESDRDEVEPSTTKAKANAKANGRTAGESPGVATFVLMCASCTRDVAFHGALVLGSIAQHDDIRAAIGDCGGIDALFLLASTPNDEALVAQATWALATATWNRENQYRVARYLDNLYRVCTYRSTASDNQDSQDHNSDPTSDNYSEQIREHGLCVLANALFYNDANRQLVASQTKWMTLLHFNCLHTSGSLLEHTARAFCSLSYSDSIALALGGSSSPSSLSDPQLAAARAVHGLEVFIRLCGHSENALVQKHGLYGVINMCLHDANKAVLLTVSHGIETLVNLSGSTHRELCDPAIEALDLLADVRSATHTVIGSSSAGVLSPSTMSSLASTDLKKLIVLLQDVTGNPALVAMASDAIADEVWKKPSAKVKLRNEHGLDTLLSLCVDPNSAIAGHDKVVLSCLWALRNSIADNVRNQDYVGALRGIPQLVALFDRNRHRDDIVEAVLAVLVALVLKHPHNSQELVQCGLDMLLALAEGVGVGIGAGDEDGDATEESRRESRSQKIPVTAKKPATGVNSSSDGLTETKTPTKENSALARELLLIVAPYNVASSSALPSLGTKAPSSPTKQQRGSSSCASSTTTKFIKKPPATSTASVHLPSLHVSPLAAPASPTRRNNE